jgi:uridine kinase
MTTIPSLVIGIAGGSGAGKTTLAKRLYQELGGEENVTYLIHDCYYKDISDKPFEVRAKTNFDHPESLETDLLLQHIKDLKKGLAAQVPTYDFATHSRTTHREEMQPKKIILVEGILIFCHPELTDQMDVKVYVVRIACLTV